MSETAKPRNRARTSRKTTSGSFARTAADIKRDARALELRTEGWAYQEIADELGVSRSTAFRGIKHALADIEQPAVEQYRLEMNEQIDKMQSMLMERLEDADDDTLTKLLSRVERLLERRARLNGLDAPVKAELDVKNVTVNLRGIDAEEL